MTAHNYLDPDFSSTVGGDGLSEDTVKRFRDFIRRFYREQGRDLPWRHERDPYRILVSEIMLQQTQVDRVLKKYRPFIAQFPDILTLDRTPLQRVLAAWKGLGYNRRCLALKRSAGMIVDRHGGIIPAKMDQLLELPGVGRATAAGILCFAYGKPAVYLETNIRNVFIHLFFNGRNSVHDRDILPLLEQTLDRDNPREWYYGLMDYGSLLKKKLGALNERSTHYVKQPTFEGSDRQLRGRILGLLLERPLLTEHEICGAMSENISRVSKIVADLTREGFIIQRGSRYRIAD